MSDSDADVDDSVPLRAVPSAEHVRMLRLGGAASVLTALALIALKTWALVATGSVAVLGSLADSALDLVASLITFFALRVAVEPPDREHRFGHGKSEAVAGLVQAVIVFGSALFVGYRAVVRLLDPLPVTAPAVGTTVMIVSLALTLGLVLLQRHIVGRTGSLAVAADSVHYRADLLTTTAVLAALFLSSRFGWHLADPVLGLVVVAVILASVREIVGSAVGVLLDRELDAGTRERILDIARSHPDVLGVHDLRTRSGGLAQFVQLHIEVAPRLPLDEAHAISVEVQRTLEAELPKADILIHVDPFGR